MNMIPYEWMNIILTGNKILDSVFGQGMQNLVSDATATLQIIGSAIIVAIFIYVSIKKSKEEEQNDRKRLSNWQVTLIVLEVLVVCAPQIFELAKAYFVKG